jgi:hypothetical protein
VVDGRELCSAGEGGEDAGRGGADSDVEGDPEVGPPVRNEAELRQTPGSRARGWPPLCQGDTDSGTELAPLCQGDAKAMWRLAPPCAVKRATEAEKARKEPRREGVEGSPDGSANWGLRAVRTSV